MVGDDIEIVLDVEMVRLYRQSAGYIRLPVRSMPQRGFNRRMKLSSSRVVNVWDCGASRKSVFHAWCSTTLMAAPRAKSRCAKIVMRLNQSCFGHGSPYLSRKLTYTLNRL